MQKDYLIITLAEKEKWNKIVKSFKEWDVFYLSDYVESFKYVNKDVPFLFYYNDGKSRAINIFFKEKIKNEKFKISSPYGYGGFIYELEENCVNKINTVFENYCKENNIVKEFVRFNLFSKSYEKYYGNIKAVKKNVIRPINMDPNEMLKDFEYKVRKNLKKAEEHDLKIQIDKTGETLQDFIKIYYSTMKRNNAKERYYFTDEFFESLCQMKENAIIFNVLFNNQVISTELVLYSDKNCYSFLGGTLSEYFYVRPNDFLKYEIIKWAYSNNIKNFVLGGGYTNDINDGILRYKKSLAPKYDMENFYIGEWEIKKEENESL